MTAQNTDSTARAPITLRGTQRPTTTTDQHLLEEEGPGEWVHSDPWRVMRIQAEFVEGFGALAELGPAISIFGSARIPADHPDYAKAEQIARGVVDPRVRRHSRAADRGSWRPATRAPRSAAASPSAWASSCLSNRA
jgi:hypothetical protein